MLASEDAMAVVRTTAIERKTVLGLAEELVGQNVMPRLEGRPVRQLLLNIQRRTAGGERLATETGRRSGVARR